MLFRWNLRSCSKNILYRRDTTTANTGGYATGKYDVNCIGMRNYKPGESNVVYTSMEHKTPISITSMLSIPYQLQIIKVSFIRMSSHGVVEAYTFDIWIEKGCLARFVSDKCSICTEIPRRLRLHGPTHAPVLRQTVYQMRPIFKPKGTFGILRCDCPYKLLIFTFTKYKVTERSLMLKRAALYSISNVSAGPETVLHRTCPLCRDFTHRS